MDRNADALLMASEAAEEGFEEERQSTLSGLLSSKLVPVDVFEGTYVEFEVKCEFKGGLECEAGATVFHQKRSRSECQPEEQCSGPQKAGAVGPKTRRVHREGPLKLDTRDSEHSPPPPLALS